MNYDMTTPCDQCPFLTSLSRGFTHKRLREFAAGEFPCHKTARDVEDEDGFSYYAAHGDSQHCAGALIYNEKRGRVHQMARICARIGIYDPRKLNMEAGVR